MKAIINGSLAPVRKSVSVNFDSTRGMTVKQEWESAGDNLQGLATTCYKNRITYDLNASPKKSTLVASATGAQAGYPEIAIDTWQLLANEIQKDLKEHPQILTLEENNPGAIGKVVKDVASYNEGGTVADETFYDDWPTASSLYQHLIRGITHFALGQYVLRHTTSVSNTYASNVSDNGVECIYTTDQLLSEVTDGTSWLYPMPGRLVYKIGSIPSRTAHTGFMWGWRKLPSTETTGANNRVEISTEYWLEEWSTFIYSPY